MTLDDKTEHEQIFLDCFGGQNLSDEDFFLLFILLYNYDLVLVKDQKRWYGLTQRGASAILSELAKLHPDMCLNKEFHRYEHWYRVWNVTWDGDKSSSQLTKEQYLKLLEFRSEVEKHPLVMSYKLL